MDKSILECIISMKMEVIMMIISPIFIPFFLNNNVDMIIIIIVVVVIILVVVVVLVVILGVYEICCNTLDTAHLRFTLHFTQ